MLDIKELNKYDIFNNEILLSLKLLEEQGLCNQNYLLKTNHSFYIVRILNTSLQIDRKKEYKNQMLANKINLAAKILLLDLDNSLMICEYVEGIHKKEISNINIKAISNLLKNLHKIKKAYNKVNLYGLYKTYKNKVFSISNTLKIENNFKNINQYEEDLCLCHSDLNPGNILFNKNKIMFIDWEYSCFIDKYFDLVSIIIEFNLDEKEEKYFLDNYFSNKEKVNFEKIKSYKIIYLVLSILWFDLENEKKKKFVFSNKLLNLLKNSI